MVKCMELAERLQQQLLGPMSLLPTQQNTIVHMRYEYKMALLLWEIAVRNEALSYPLHIFLAR